MDLLITHFKKILTKLRSLPNDNNNYNIGISYITILAIHRFYVRYIMFWIVSRKIRKRRKNTNMEKENLQDNRIEIIEQAEFISEHGCRHIRNCESECLLRKNDICDPELLFDYDDAKCVASAFLEGIIFAQGY